MDVEATAILDVICCASCAPGVDIAQAPTQRDSTASHLLDGHNTSHLQLGIGARVLLEPSREDVFRKLVGLGHRASNPRPSEVMDHNGLANDGIERLANGQADMAVW